MRDPRLTPERARRELEMMADSGRWPLATTLPLKRMSEDYRGGYLEVAAPGQKPEPVVHVDEPGSASAARRYQSFEAIHEDGWLID